MGANGTVRVARCVPVPDTLSPAAQKAVSVNRPDTEPPYDVAKDRAAADAWQAKGGEEIRKTYPVNVEQSKIAGVPVRIVTPPKIPVAKQNRVLINVHGGGFNADWGSMIESIPVANLTQTKVVSVLYSLAPEHKFPTQVNETVAVYKELLKAYKPQNIGLYGTSAGAILTAEVASELRKEGLPLPAALGIFSGSGDFSTFGDSMFIYGLWGLSGPISRWTGKHDTGYTGTTDLKDPVLSPIYANLRGFPPTLFLTSGRDLLLSNTVNLHRAFVNAGVAAQVVVFDGLWHAFWNDWNLPESKEAHHMMADFFDSKLAK
ncbi:MAG TPA: alpha/beta hydrolase [Terriglobales bacterium]|nr:alpha/beta hydrolase [Terriglobales bacterium]